MAIRHRYAVIHGVEEVGAIAVAVARLTGARAIFEKHSDPASHRDNPIKNLILSLYRWVEGLAIRTADMVSAQGKAWSSRPWQ